MKSLSNFLRRSDASGAPPANLVYHPARNDQRSAALRLILGTPDYPADEAQVVDFLQFALERDIPLSDLWIAEANDKVVWAILPVVNPGRTMLLLASPSPANSTQEHAARELIGLICVHFRDRGVHLAQALLDPEEKAGHRLLLSAGFRRVSELQYLQTVVRRAPAPPALPAGFSLQSYSPVAHARFARCILDTYQESLDCPSLNGLRDIEDVIAGHKATGEFHPQGWSLLCEGEEASGVLLLNSLSHGDSMELVYLGLTPAARGRGLSRVLMSHALAVVGQQGRSRLTLAVDAANPPALKLYHSYGMHRICTKLALMRDLRQMARVKT